MDQITQYWPLVLVAVGAVLLAYGQRGRLSGVWAWFWGLISGSSPIPDPAEMTLTDRLEYYVRLRIWLRDAGRIKAVDAMDSVLPDLVEEKLP